MSKTYLVVKISSITYFRNMTDMILNCFPSPQTFRNHVSDVWHVTKLSTNYMLQPCHIVNTVVLFSEFVVK